MSSHVGKKIAIAFVMMLLARTASGALISENFEGYSAAPDTDTATYGGGDFDPAGPWTTTEGATGSAKVVAHTSPGGPNNERYSPPAGGGAKYLMFHIDSLNAYSALNLSPSEQASVAAKGQMSIEADVIRMTDNQGYFGWARITGYSGANKAFDVIFTNTGAGNVRYNASNENTGSDVFAAGDDQAIPGSPTLAADTWAHVVLDVDFGTDTFDLTLGNTTYSNLTWGGGNLSSIDRIVVGDIYKFADDNPLPPPNFGTVSRTNFQPARSGYDNIVVFIPEPATAVLCGAGSLFMARRRRA